MDAPYLLRGSRTQWGLNCTDVECGALVNLPGIRFNDPESRVEGAIDAIAAAAVRLQRKGLPRTTYEFRLPREGLREYQNNGVDRLLGIQRLYGGALLADDMGLGKTLQAIHTALARNSTRVLIAAPGLARETWLEELLKWGQPEESIALALPKGDKRRADNLRKLRTARWIISSYDLLPLVQEELGTTYPDYYIMDEAHRIKNAGRKTSQGEVKRAKASQDIATIVPYKLALTGTPNEDRPRDLYGILRILFGRGLWGSSYEFDLAYCGGHQGKHGFVADGISRPEELKLRLSYYMVRREKKDVAKELPSKSRNVIWLPEDAKATSVFQQAMLKLTTIQEASLACLEAKLPYAVEKAHQAKRFLLFTYRRDHAASIHQKLCQEGTKCVLITGDMTPVQRTAMVAVARNERIGMVATIDSAGESLNLQGVASYGIMHHVDWRPAKIAQGEDRIYRIGQTEPVQWDYLALRESMDALIVRTLVNKMDMQRAVMPGMSAQTDIRNDLGAYENGAGVSEEDALKLLYQEMDNARSES